MSPARWTRTAALGGEVSLVVVAPQVTAADLCRPVVSGESHERGRQSVFLVALHVDDRTVVVGLLALGELRALDRFLRVEDRVVGVLVGGLVDGSVEGLGSEHVALVGISVIPDQADVAGLASAPAHGLLLVRRTDDVL